MITMKRGEDGDLRIETVARLLYEVDAGRMRTRWEELPDGLRQRYLRLAAAFSTASLEAPYEEWRQS